MKDHQFKLIFGVLLYIAARQSTDDNAGYFMFSSALICISGMIDGVTDYVKKWWKK